METYRHWCPKEVNTKKVVSQFIRGILTLPNQDDQMNMTKKVELDRKIYNNKHLPSNLTENIINITTMKNIYM